MQSEVRTAASPIVTYFKEPPIDLDDDRPRRKPATVDVGAPGAAPRCGGLGVAQADGAALHHATPRCAEDHPTYFAPPCRAQGRAMRQCLKSPRSVRLPPPRRGKKYPAVRYCTANTVRLTRLAARSMLSCGRKQFDACFAKACAHPTSMRPAE